MSATETTTEEIPELRFVISFEDQQDYGLGRSLRVTANAVHQFADGRIRNPDSSSFHADPFADFQVTGWYNKDSQGGFHWSEAEVKPYTVRLRDAERIVKTLRKVAKGLERLNERFGYTGDFATHLGRVADVAKAGKNPFLVKVGGRDTGSYDDHEYRAFDVTAIAMRFESTIKAWREKHGYVLEEATA